MFKVKKIIRKRKLDLRRKLFEKVFIAYRIKIENRFLSKYLKME
jgi:hypothetical protein